MSHWRAETARVALYSIISGARGDIDEDVAVGIACDLATALAKEACSRWGHQWEDGTCGRCGAIADRNAETIPPKGASQ